MATNHHLNTHLYVNISNCCYEVKKEVLTMKAENTSICQYFRKLSIVLGKRCFVQKKLTTWHVCQVKIKIRQFINASALIQPGELADNE